jgi:hypothetical protein
MQSLLREETKEKTGMAYPRRKGRKGYTVCRQDFNKRFELAESCHAAWQEAYRKGETQQPGARPSL